MVHNTRHDVDLDLLNEWITDRLGGDLRCPLCDAEEWLLDEQYLTPLPLVQGKLDMSGSVLPFITMTCSNCANTLFFHAQLMGVKFDKTGDGDA